MPYNNLPRPAGAPPCAPADNAAGPAATGFWSLPPRTLELPADPESGGRARQFVTATARQLGLGRGDIGDIEVAVGEAVTNALLYGCRAPEAAARPDAVRVTVSGDGECLVIEIRDHGPGFEEGAARRTAVGNGEEIGGRGLLLMRALMHRVEIRCDASGTSVRMEYHLAR